MPARLRIRYYGAWREISALYAQHLGAGRRLKSLKVYRDGAWRRIGNLVQPLTVSANNVQAISTTGQSNLTTPASTANPSGGLPPFSYTWEPISGGATINSPNSASSTFSKTVIVGAPSVTTHSRVTVTDAQGTAASTTISAYFQSASITGRG